MLLSNLIEIYRSLTGNLADKYIVQAETGLIFPEYAGNLKACWECSRHFKHGDTFQVLTVQDRHQHHESISWAMHEQCAQQHESHLHHSFSRS